MGKSSGGSKKPIQGNTCKGSIEKQNKIHDALSKMTDGKYLNTSLMGTEVTDANSFLFDTKGDLTKATRTIKKAQRQIATFSKTLDELAELGLCERLDRQVRHEIRRMPLKTAYDLVLDNAARVGAISIISKFSGLLFLGLIEYNNRITEAKEIWPKGKSKPKPVKVARAIAEVYVIHMEERPSYGTNANAPSTAYSKAVERIFQILGIEANSSEAAKYAVNECTPEKIAEILTANARSKKSAIKSTLMR